MNPPPKIQKAVALKYDKEKSDAPKVIAKEKVRLLTILSNWRMNMIYLSKKMQI